VHDVLPGSARDLKDKAALRQNAPKHSQNGLFVALGSRSSAGLLPVHRLDEAPTLTGIPRVMELLTVDVALA
jgi:hypothetical protein